MVIIAIIIPLLLLHGLVSKVYDADTTTTTRRREGARKANVNPSLVEYKFGSIHF